MTKLGTPLVIGTVFVVTVLSVVRLVLMPESWGSSLAALLFFPSAFGVLAIRSRYVADPEKARMVSGKLRASLVGAGVLLATSMLLSITDHIGLTGQGDGGNGGNLIPILSALAAVAIDLLSGRLERKAEEDSDKR